jgi:hypothetical protein
MPTSGPIPALRKYRGMASPPEPLALANGERRGKRGRPARNQSLLKAPTEITYSVTGQAASTHLRIQVTMGVRT